MYVFIVIKFIVPKFAPTFTEISKTGTTITVSWTTNSTDADGYVVSVTSDTNTVTTQQVKGGNQSTTTLRGLRVGTTYNITIRAYQDILSPVSNTISVQTNSGITNVISISIQYLVTLLLPMIILSPFIIL